MSFLMKAGAAWAPARPYVKVSGVWKATSEAWVNAAGAWKRVWFSVTAASNQYRNSMANAFDFNAVSVTIVGGVAPYTYLWAISSGGAFSIHSGQTTNACVVRVSGVGVGNTASTTAWCTVTDATGLAIVSNQLILQYTQDEWIGPGPTP